MQDLTEPRWLSDWRRSPIGADQALARLDSLPGIEPDEMQGRWRGTGLGTGHPFDGILEVLGWYGKAFESPEHVQPLLFRCRTGVVPVDPAWVPVGIALRWPMLPRSRLARAAFPIMLPLFRTDRSTARLYSVAFRGRSSAALVYDRQPIVDHFRKIGNGMVLGLMDMRGVAPFFFLLTREDI